MGTCKYPTQTELSYFKAQEWGRAAAAWEDLLHYRPDNEAVRVLLPQTYYILAVEYNRLGNPSMGRQSFKNALSVNQNTNQWLASSMATLGGYYREKRMYRSNKFGVFIPFYHSG